jgi:hypothetical protein
MVAQMTSEKLNMIKDMIHQLMDSVHSPQGLLEPKFCIAHSTNELGITCK